MTDSTSKWLPNLLFLTLAMSAFVFVEPSPYDLFFILIMLIGFVFSIYNFTKDMIFPLLILCVFLICNLLPLFFIEEIGSSIFFTAITFYLAFTWIVLIGMSDFIKPPYLQFILHGYLISACISAIIGILAYFYILPSSDFFLMYGRAKALFKDPNVFGPFLVIPALFSISMAELKDRKLNKKVFYYLTFLLLSAGIIISFSRAAWGNFAISLLIYLCLFKINHFRNRIHTIIFLILIGIPGILYFIQTPMVEDLLVTRLSYQGYDNDRFDTQLAAFESGLSNPFGIGPGQSENTFQYSPHSLYARVFTENGVVGLISFSLLLIVSIFKAFARFWNAKVYGTLYLVIFASLTGLAFNSLFVDTLHWRHLWLLLALAWLPEK
ncbi:O-antigen ligase family protein [Psychrobacillus sp. NEAU-3TGS]|uniref:O-antigen ligase family protein n=1 Tax=Psychrobacillus sp. NEAU-3TGS TaxID=2995412 RepID=UPI002496F5F2|nr:O-antigen ligase family protein [Psychrobacillus sp. NEAU-3TGS]MDI2586533.1 O-antigen ligase family protein [Psychrobacillus sp. NEAU-3TGS]